MRVRKCLPHFWVLRLEEFKPPTSEEDHKGPFECNRGEAARGPINSAHFLMAVRVKPNPLRRSVVSRSLNDIKHLIKALQGFVLESSTTLTGKLNVAGGREVWWSFWVTQWRAGWFWRSQYVSGRSCQGPVWGLIGHHRPGR